MSVSANSPVTNAWNRSEPLTLERGIKPNQVHSPTVLAGLLSRRLRATDRELDIYVNPTTGNDNNHGQDAQNPIASLAQAAKLVPEALMHKVRIHVVGSHTLTEDVVFAAICLDGGLLFIDGGFDNVTEVAAEITPTSSTASTLTTSGLTGDAFRGRLAEFTDGTLVGKRVMALGNTTTVVSLGFSDASIDTDNAGDGPKFRIVTPSTTITSSTGKTLRFHVTGAGLAGMSAAVYVQNLLVAGDAKLHFRETSFTIAGCCYSSTSTSFFTAERCPYAGFNGSILDADAAVVFNANGYAGLGYTGALSGNNGRVSINRAQLAQVIGSVIPVLAGQTSYLTPPHAETLHIAGTRLLTAISLRGARNVFIGDSGVLANTRIPALTLAQSIVELDELIVDGATVHGVLVSEGSICTVIGVVSGANAGATGGGMTVQGGSQLHLKATPTLTCQAGAVELSFDGTNQIATYANADAAGAFLNALATPDSTEDTSLIAGYVA